MYSDMMNWVGASIEKDEGVFAIEYGLIAALISVVIFAGLGLLGGELNTTFDAFQGALANENSGGAS